MRHSPHALKRWCCWARQRPSWFQFDTTAAMPWQLPAQERHRMLLRARRWIWVALGAFVVVGVAGVLVVIADPARWWVWLIALAICGYLVARNLQRLRVVNRELPIVEDEIRRPAPPSPLLGIRDRASCLRSRGSCSRDRGGLEEFNGEVEWRVEHALHRHAVALSGSEFAGEVAPLGRGLVYG